MTFPTGEIMFDVDGSIAMFTNSDQVSGISDITASLASFRNVGAGSLNLGLSSRTTYIFFPEPLDLTRLWPECSNLVNPRMHFSTDSVAPGTGSWFDWSSGAAQAANSIAGGSSWASLSRSNMATGVSDPHTWHASAVGVRAVRFRGSTNVSGGSPTMTVYRLWGEPSSPTTFLRLWDATVDAAAPDDLFDLAPIERGSFGEIDFRIKNLHPSLNVNNVTLSTPNGYGNNSAQDHYTFDDGSGFAAPLDIGTINADSLSSVITMRRTVAIDQFPGASLVSLLLDGTWAA
jgi:hypothetical protein